MRERLRMVATNKARGRTHARANVVLGVLVMLAASAGGAERCLAPKPYLDEVPATAVLDSNWLRVAPGMLVTKALSMKGKWAASLTWFYTDTEPNRYLVMETLDSLMSWGLLNDQSRVSAETHRFLVKAHSFDEAAVAVRRAAAKKPPREIRERLVHDETAGSKDHGQH